MLESKLNPCTVGGSSFLVPRRLEDQEGGGWQHVQEGPEWVQVSPDLLLLTRSKSKAHLCLCSTWLGCRNEEYCKVHAPGWETSPKCPHSPLPIPGGRKALLPSARLLLG